MGKSASASTTTSGTGTGTGVDECRGPGKEGKGKEKEGDDWELPIPPPLDTRRRGEIVNPDRAFISALAANAEDGKGKGKGRTRREWCNPDWAGVEGVWIGSYAFVDYRIFHAFNFHDQPIARSPEAVGNLMSMKLTLVEPPHLKPTPRERLRSNTRDGYGNDFKNDSFPTLYFEGTRRPFGGHGQDIKTHGCVRLAQQRPGEALIPHWTFVVGYGGEDRWRLEGLQPGGIGSRSGVVGNWSSAEEEDYAHNPDHPETPVGPFAYWPIYDEVEP
ncbi:hypothetical protein BT69DRAFT_632649 [Atractiella rhizophila]|nr:hypothetical protein BT69DRAFT_632649 [Atractiella rhizophila]